ncbi:MAG: anaerobic ribonucleoside-triphosphate reductase activating protein [Candidatus Pacebacteria bacterium]|nr:anaerobic ribonucleoside-triphosphate reductase activating protein [Candidatus Paceibacterota bacterium]
MKIGGLQKVTLIDYPGKIACTVFLSGCNFRCPFCYSKELVLPEEIKNHPAISSEDFFNFLEGKKGLLDGCVVCGGEPTVNGEELIDFCKKIKDMGFLVKIDTNGSNPELLEDLISKKLIDYIAMDVKAPLEKEKYGKATGVKDIDINKIKKSINLIKDSGVDYEFRTTISPQIHSIEDIIQIAKEVSGSKRYFLQQLRKEKETISDGINSYREEDLEEVKKQIKDLFQIFRLR